MTSQDTFESSFRRRLLDVLYAQWGKLGAPFSDVQASNNNEVIDPEALLWCSLEFLPSEPRLSEAVQAWIATQQDYLVRQRVYKISRENDPRSLIWEALDRPTARIRTKPIQEPCYGLSSVGEVTKFVERVREGNALRAGTLGRAASGTSTLLLRARDLLGQDIRHFLLVYLLANSHGARLRDIQAWSGHSYRSLSEAAGRWERAGVISLDTGYCRLLAAEPFRLLLKIGSERIVVVNWLTVFEVGVRLLRDLARARQKGFDAKSEIVAALQRGAGEALRDCSPNPESGAESSVVYLLQSGEVSSDGGVGINGTRSLVRGAR